MGQASEFCFSIYSIILKASFTPCFVTLRREPFTKKRRQHTAPPRTAATKKVPTGAAGDSVCADGRLLECASLTCAESALTGESLPVEKDTDEISGETALGDRKNMVFSGSFVTYGRGRFLVTATGMDTEMGKSLCC